MQRPPTILPNVDSVLILACGTSYYSSLVAKQWIETLAKMPCTVEIASEYRYRDSVPHENALVLVVSQSGETADTLAALKHAKSLGHKHTLAICNVPTSSMVRQTEMVFLTRAGYRGRRGVDEGVHHTARCAVPVGADAREAARTPVGRPGGRNASMRCATSPQPSAARWRSSRI